MDLDISTANGKLTKVIKKSMKEKRLMLRIEPTSSGLTAKFKFLSQVSHKQRHPHPFMQILIDAGQYHHILKKSLKILRNIVVHFEKGF
jgi:hypothetical protein